MMHPKIHPEALELAGLLEPTWAGKLSELQASGVPLNANVVGQRQTENILQDQRAVDMRTAILELEPNAAPLTVITSRLPSKGTHNPEFSWVENSLASRFDAVNDGTGMTSGDTAMVVDDATKFEVQDLVKVTRTGEVVRVTAINTGTNTLTVTRGVGGGAAAINDNDELLKIGSAFAEGSRSKDAVSKNPSKVTNYTQIVKTPFEASETLIHSDTYTSPRDFDMAANHAGIEHKKDWEEIYIAGKPSETTANGETVRTTGGCLHFITSNINSIAGTMTEAEFYAGFRTAFRFGNQTQKTLFASELFVETINTYPRSKLELIQSDNDTTFGLRVMRFVSPFGNLNVVTHYLLEGSTYGGYGIVLDMSNVRARPLQNAEGSRDTRLVMNIQETDRDGRKHEYRTERGLEFGLEKTHALYTGVTGAA